jgi:hypothetical protein
LRGSGPRAYSRDINDERRKESHIWDFEDFEKEDLLTVGVHTDCWAAGAASGGCGHLEGALRDCMDAAVSL